MFYLCLLDKNHANLTDIYKSVIEPDLCTVISQEPFLKTSFILKVLKTAKIPVTYIDFDLMYSGNIKSGMVEESHNVRVYRPDFSNYTDMIKSIITNTIKTKCLVILDTINGFFNLHGNNDAGRAINSYISLLSFVAKNTDSSILITCTGSYTNKKWIISPALGRIVHGGSKILLRRNGISTIADVFDRNDIQIYSTIC